MVQTVLDTTDPRALAEFYRDLLGWSYRPRTPAWLTEECHELIANALAAAVTAAEPLGPTRGRHIELEAIRSCTLDMAAWSDVSRRVGVPISLPYFDDHVIDAEWTCRTCGEPVAGLMGGLPETKTIPPPRTTSETGTVRSRSARRSSNAAT